MTPVAISGPEVRPAVGRAVPLRLEPVGATWTTTFRSEEDFRRVSSIFAARHVPAADVKL
jgi:hypothetical protein